MVVNILAPKLCARLVITSYNIYDSYIYICITMLQLHLIYQMPNQNSVNYLGEAPNTIAHKYEDIIKTSRQRGARGSWPFGD